MIIWKGPTEGLSLRKTQWDAGINWCTPRSNYTQPFLRDTVHRATQKTRTTQTVLKAEKVTSPYLEQYMFMQVVKTNCKDSCSPITFSTKKKIKMETILNTVTPYPVKSKYHSPYHHPRVSWVITPMSCLSEKEYTCHCKWLLQGVLPNQSREI